MKRKERLEFSSDQIDKLRSRIDGDKDLRIADNLCVYMTGSYARMEASRNSDLDLFFISEGEFSKIDKILVDAALIKVSREMSICDFSGDGKYLEIHKLEDMTKEMGGQLDDYENYFTARLLLLLESQPLINVEKYEQFIDKIIDCYLRDYDNHEKDFKPTFLMNDIVRYWKTITLNYENKRIENPDDGKMRASNFKLRFSRKLMCFSFLMRLIALEKPIQKSDIWQIVQQTPIQRLKSLEDRDPESIKGILDSYDWFLDKTALKKRDLIQWLSVKKNRDQAFAKSEEFGELLFDALKTVDVNRNLRYLVI